MGFIEEDYWHKTLLLLKFRIICPKFKFETGTKCGILLLYFEVI
jgi:hypothetical protein